MKSRRIVIDIFKADDQKTFDVQINDENGERMRELLHTPEVIRQVEKAVRSAMNSLK